MATTNTLGAKTDKGLEGIEHKIYLKKKSTQAKTIPNFNREGVTRVSGA